MTELSGSVFETLRADGEFVLSRVEMEGLPTLILTPAADQPALESLKRLEHEYLLWNELDPTWAVRPRGLTRDHGRLTLLLDDPGGELLAGLVGQPWDVPQFLRSRSAWRLRSVGSTHRDLSTKMLSRATSW